MNDLQAAALKPLHRLACSLCGEFFETNRGLSLHHAHQHRAQIHADAAGAPWSDIAAQLSANASLAEAYALAGAASEPLADGDTVQFDILYDSMDEDAPLNPPPASYHTERSCRPVATPLGRCDTPFQTRAALDDDNIYSPFADKHEWDFARWIVQSGISQGETDRLLQLPQVCFFLHISNTCSEISDTTP